MTENIPADPAAFLRELIGRSQRGTLARLKRVPSPALYWQPHRESNSIGVTVWHYTRWYDLFGTVSLVDGKIDDQHWFRDGWMERTGYDPRGLGSGGLGNITGYTVDQMLAVPHLSAIDLAAYHTACAESFLTALARDDAATLTRPMRVADEEGTRYAHVLGLVLGVHRHLGEIDALAALYERQQVR